MWSPRVFGSRIRSEAVTASERNAPTEGNDSGVGRALPREGLGDFGASYP